MTVRITFTTAEAKGRPKLRKRPFRSVFQPGFRQNTAVFHRITLWPVTLNGHNGGMGERGPLGRLIAVLCILLGVPAGAEPPSAPAITRRSQLSPLARVVDDLLFGNGQSAPSYEQNPFDRLYFPASEMKSVMGEIRALRGEALSKLEREGLRVNYEFREAIQKATVESLAADRIKLNPNRIVANSWLSLAAQAESGERKLNPTELHIHALNKTAEQFPQAFNGGTGLENPVAAGLYNKNAFRAEIFETASARTLISQSDFEAWRDNEMKSLAEQFRTNQLRIIRSHLDSGSWRLRLQTPAGIEKGETIYRQTPLTWERYLTLVAPSSYEKKYGPQGAYLAFTPFIQLKLPPLTTIVDRSGHEIQSITPDPIEAFNHGALDLEQAVDGHRTRLLIEANSNLYSSMVSLSRFQYGMYRRDRGKAFWGQWEKRYQEVREKLRKLHEVPRATESMPAMKQAEPGFELALWGRFAEDPNYWRNLREKSKRTWREFFLGPKESLFTLSSEPPTPLSTRANDAAAQVTKFTKKWVALPLAFAAGLALASHYDVIPTLPELAAHVGANNANPEAELPSKFSAVGTAWNKPLSSLGDRELFRITPRTGETSVPNRFAFGRPSEATRPTTVPGDSSHSDFVLDSSGYHRGVSEVPTGDGTVLSAMRVTGKDGAIWKPGIDYDLRRTSAGEAVVFPRNENLYSVQAGFDGGIPARPELVNHKLKSIPPEVIKGLAGELQANGFHYLPELLREVASYSLNRNLPISAYDFEQILRESAYYSQLPEMASPWFATELEQAARFLNPEGTACYQCDGARELGVSLYRRVLTPESGINVIPRNVVTRSPGSLRLATSGAHADFVLDDTKNDQRIVVDVTPGKRDPRDHTPYPAGSRATSPYAAEAQTVRSPAVLAALTNLPAEKAAPERGPIDPFPWRGLIEGLAAKWNQGMVARPPTRGSARPAVAGAGPEPGETSSERSHPVPQEPIELPLSGHWESDPLLEELSKRASRLKTLVAELKVFPGGGDRIPTSVMTDLLRQVERYLKGESTEGEFHKATANYVPAGFVVPIGADPRHQVGRTVEAVWNRQMSLLNRHREQWKRGETKAYPGLLNPRLVNAMEELAKWTVRQGWQGPRWVPDQPNPATLPCHLQVARLR